MDTSLSRRTLTKGAAWSIPAIMIGAPAPALAASKPSGCQTIPWVGGTYTGSPGRRTYTYRGVDFQVTVSQNQTGGSGHAGSDPRSDVNPDSKRRIAAPPRNFIGTKAGEQQGVNQQGNVGVSGFLRGQGSNFNVDTAATTSALTLSQGSVGTVARDTLTWTFSDANGKPLTPSLITFQVYDISAVTNPPRSIPNARYTDVVAIGGVPSSAVTLSSVGTERTFSIDKTKAEARGTKQSPAGIAALGVSITPDRSSFSLTYSNDPSTVDLKEYSKGYVNNSQYIAIGDVTIC